MALVGEYELLRVRPTLDWEKESIHRPAPVQNFSVQKKMTEERFR